MFVIIKSNCGCDADHVTDVVPNINDIVRWKSVNRKFSGRVAVRAFDFSTDMVTLIMSEVTEE